MDAYESGSSEGWFFWNFKTETSPQWDFILGLKEGWIQPIPEKRKNKC
jgi:glucan 1,3-beta-glucosidase